jgi:hypothetical protein
MAESFYSCADTNFIEGLEDPYSVAENQSFLKLVKLEKIKMEKVNRAFSSDSEEFFEPSGTLI